MQKTVFITGGAKRIGAYIARGLHQAGMDIIIHYNTSRIEANALVEKLNALRPESATLVCANLADHDSLQPLCDTALKFKGKINVLINNASVFRPTPAQKVSRQAWGEIMDVNLKAPFFLSQLLAASTGLDTIINIADVHADRPLRRHSIYSISQAGMIMLTKAMAKDLAPDTRVNAVSPGAITWPEGMTEDSKKTILKKVSLNRIGTGKDIFNAILFLIEQADYMTGQVLTIDGGRTLYS